MVCLLGTTIYWTKFIDVQEETKLLVSTKTLNIHCKHSIQSTPFIYLWIQWTHRNILRILDVWFDKRTAIFVTDYKTQSHCFIDTVTHVLPYKINVTWGTSIMRQPTLTVSVATDVVSTTRHISNRLYTTTMMNLLRRVSRYSHCI